MEQLGFQFALVKRFGKREEIEDIRVLKRLGDKVGLRGGKLSGEIVDGFPLPEMGIAFDHQAQDITAPTERQRLLHIPLAVAGALDLLQENDVVEPRNAPK